MSVTHATYIQELHPSAWPHHDVISPQSNAMTDNPRNFNMHKADQVPLHQRTCLCKGKPSRIAGKHMPDVSHVLHVTRPSNVSRWPVQICLTQIMRATASLLRVVEMLVLLTLIYQRSGLPFPKLHHKAFSNFATIATWICRTLQPCERLPWFFNIAMWIRRTLQP